MPNFSDSGVVGNAPFICTFVSDNDCLGDAEEGLSPRKRAAGVFNTLYDLVDVQCMFPNESVNARILRDHFISTIGQLIACFRTFAGAVVNEGLGDMRNFIL